jgi:anti-sigma factor RsiW
MNRSASSTHQSGMDWVLRPWVATCGETRDLLSAHLEGALGGREAKRVLRHLARCRQCRDALRSLARTVDGLRLLGRADAFALDPASVVDAVVVRIRSNSS